MADRKPSERTVALAAWDYVTAWRTYQWRDVDLEGGTETTYEQWSAAEDAMNAAHNRLIELTELRYGEWVKPVGEGTDGE